MRRCLIATLIAMACAPASAPVAPSASAPVTSAMATATPTSPIAALTAAPTKSAAPAASMRWSRIADIPTPRSEVVAAFDAQVGAIYVIGGYGGPARVERYTAEATWERVADLPHGVDHAMAVAVSGTQFGADEGVYVLGGNVDGVATARSFRLDRRTGTWSEIAPMPGPRAAGAAVVSGSRIYVFGGGVGDRLAAPTYEYALSERKWRTVASIPTPRDHLSATEFQGKVCAIGGRRLSMTANLGAFECYVPGEDRWEALPAAPTARGGAGAAAYGPYLFFIGGQEPSGTFGHVEIYDARTGTWSRGPDLPTPRHGIGVVGVHGSTPSPPWGIYVLTGGPTPGVSQTGTCEVLSLPPG